MCKLLFFSNTNGIKDKLQTNLPNIVGIMARGNKDGIGVFSETGHIKAVDMDELYMPKEYFDYHFIDSYGVDKKGDVWQGTSLAIHSRTSTNYVGLDYCHPFTSTMKQFKGNYFAHNGVVEVPMNHGFDLKTMNDSEWLANEFWHKSFSNFDSVNGYYAFINYDARENLWTIAKDNEAFLSVGYIKDNDSFIFATKKSDIEEIAKICKFKVSFIKSFKDYYFCTFTNGIYVNDGKIKPKKYNREKDFLYNKSIGNEARDQRKEYSYSLYDEGYEQGIEHAKHGLIIDDKIEALDDDFSCGFSDGYNDYIYSRSK